MNVKNVKVSFQVQIPAKLILFGEWGVLKGYSALGCSVGKYFECKVEEADTQNLIIESPEISFEWNGKNIPPPFLQKTCDILNFLYENPLKELAGKKIYLKRGWPLSEGLGSSSTLFLSLALLKGGRTPHSGPEDLIGGASLPNKLRSLLLEFQKGGSGMDIVLQALGGFQKVSEGTLSTPFKIESKNISLPEEVLLIHTGKKMKTEQALKEWENTAALLAPQLGKATDDFLATGDWEKAIKIHDQVLQKIGVVPEFVRELQQSWIDKKWLKCLKTTGAGGGDTLIALINPCARPEIEEDLQKRGYWLEEAPLGVPGILTKE